MPFNWYKVACLRKLQKECIAEDMRTFAGLDFKSEKSISTTSEEPKNVDESHQYKHIGTRIDEGKKREDAMIEKINASTPFILRTTGKEDDIMGIDAFMAGYRGASKKLDTPLKVQIKQRLKGGDDLGLEIMKGWPPKSDDLREINFDGKDMKTPIDYYFHVDRAGTIRVFNGKAIRKIAESMGTAAINAWGHHAFKGHKHEINPYGEVLVVSERGIGGRKTKNNFKVIAYLSINGLTPTYEFTV